MDDLFAVIGEGAALLAGLNEDSDSFFDDLHRLREILAAVGEAAPAPAAPALLTFSLADKAGSAAALNAYLDSGIDLPAIEQAFEADTVAELARLAGDAELVNRAANWTVTTQNPNQTHTAAAKEAAFEHFRERGQAIADSFSVASNGFNRATLRDTVRDGDKLLKESIAENPEYLAARAQVTKELEERAERLVELIRIAGGKTGASEAEMDAASAEYRTLQKDGLVDRMNERNTAAWNKTVADRAARHAALFVEQGKVIVAKVLDASTVTNEDALAWAKSQLVDDDAKAKLKRQKYPVEQFYQDMADFYRLTGGKASTVHFKAGGRRASASGIQATTGEKVINLDTSFTKETLWHELAHHLENDPIAKAAANAFLMRRREGDKPYTLRSLTGSKFYAPSEIAWKDSFTDPYVGRVYKDASTEVFSMGLQYLSNPARAAWFLGKDPEHFNLVTGYVGNPLTPAMRAKLNMHTGAIGEKVDAAKEQEARFDAAIAWLAARAPITSDNWFETVDRSTYWFNMFEAYVLGKEKTRAPVYVGSSGDFKVFKGVFRKVGSARYVKSFLIVFGAEVDGETIPNNAILQGTLEEAQALVAVARINGTGPQSALYSYFFDGYAHGRKQKIIDLVDGMK